MSLRAPLNVLVLDVDGSAEVRSVEATVVAVQAIVGGYIEMVQLDRKTVMYVNEEGKDFGLPVNTAANRLVAFTNPGLHPADFIVGPVFLVGLLNAQGEMDGEEHDTPGYIVQICRDLNIPVTTMTH